MGGPRGYYAKCNMSKSKYHVISYVESEKYKTMNKQNRHKPIDTGHKLRVAKRRGIWDDRCIEMKK